MARDLYLVRHGQTLFNLKRIIQGQSDSPLTPLGVEQARRAGEFLRARGVQVGHGYCSTLARTEQTIQSVWPGLEYNRLDDLREWFFGDFEGERVMLMPERPWVDFFKGFGGEAQVEVRDRVAAALTGIMENDSHEAVLAVSHGSAIREFMDYVAGDPIGEQPVPHTNTTEDRQVPRNCATLHYAYENGAFTHAETFTQADYAAELGLDPLQ